MLSVGLRSAFAPANAAGGAALGGGDADARNMFLSSKFIGSMVVENATEGYNTCLFAYGQTGSGKSFSMMGSGSGDNRGVIPRICQELFEKAESERLRQEGNTNCKIEVSYLEIYQEKVRDLLNPSGNSNLRVREHASTGPYVEGLSNHAVEDFVDIEVLMEEGNKLRTVQSTKMNDVSSRSHAIFQITFTQVTIVTDGDSVTRTERCSKISLVDLAGSERSGQINGKSKERLREGNYINKSLSTLGKCIELLAKRSSSGKSGKLPAIHIPYRESVLTWPS